MIDKPLITKEKVKKMKKIITEKNKRIALIYLILWLLLAIVFVMPLSVAITDSTSMGEFTSIFGNYILNIQTRLKAFQANYIQSTKTALGYYSFLYLIVTIVLFIKSKDNGDYKDIEHGSSDWSQGGSQYSVLSRNSGIILAEKNYLPVDKPGNVNVLIVGRIRIW